MELSKEIHHTDVASLSQGQTSISWDLDVPVSTINNINRYFEAFWTSIDLPGSGFKRKLNLTNCSKELLECQWKPTEGTDTSSNWLSEENVEWCQLTQSIPRPVKWCLCGQRPWSTLLSRERVKSLHKTHLSNSEYLWDKVLWTDEI